jgi:hypothetical protein
MTTITTSEILEAIRIAQRSVKDPGGFTTITEMQDASGMCRTSIARHLRVFKQTGQLECQWIPREGLDGRHTVVPAYRVTKGSKGK